ncbi:MAG: Protein grpE [Firmicutes bacterium]|nr:Protein grpE [Bacillota bacterium]
MSDKDLDGTREGEINDVEVAVDAEAEVCLNQDEVQNDTQDELQTKIEAKTKEVEELNNRLLRLQADFDNFRRRTRQEKEELSQIVSNGVINQLLPILDNFERALAAGATQDSGQLLTGVDMVFRQLMQILEGFGLKSIEAVGATLDPAQHEAVMRVEDPDQPDGLIVQELQKGYMAHNKVLRASMVKVISNS